MSKFPKLSGQPKGYIEKQLKDFIAGDRNNDGGQMVSIVTELAPKDIPIVAAWYASQVPPEPVDTDEDTSTGKVAFLELRCVDCHDTKQVDANSPRLSAQHADYLGKQMREFRDGFRTNDPGGLMQSAMEGITDAEIAAISTYLAATPRDDK